MEVHRRSCLVNFWSNFRRVKLKWNLLAKTNEEICFERNWRKKKKKKCNRSGIFYLNKQRHDIMAGQGGRSLPQQIGIRVLISLTSRTCLSFISLCKNKKTRTLFYESEALLINEKARGFLGIMNILLREGPGADRERRRQIELLLYWRERKKEEEEEERKGEEREKHRLLGW